MAHPISEQGPPETLRDPEPEKKPPARVSRRVAIGGGIALLVLGVVAALVYLFVWRYQPLARRHIPGNANLVVRIEVADAVLFAPVREHLWPLLIAPGPTIRGKGRGERIKDATGVNVATDVREIIIASVDATSWVVIAGGRLPRGRFVAGLEEVAREEKWAGVHREGELLVGPGGVAVGQADDGTIVIGTNANLVTAALPASDEHGRLALPADGAVSFAVTQQAWRGVAGISMLAGATALNGIERASGRFTLGAAPALSMIVEPASGVAAADLARDLEQLLGRVRLFGFLMPDFAGEKGALQAASVTVSGDRVAITAVWPYEGLDKGCRRLAGVIRAALGS